MNDELHSLVGAYVLDALSDDERRAFEDHLARCSTCAVEATEFAATAARLGAAAEVAVPTGLKSRVLEQVARTPQERPGVVPISRARRWSRTLPMLAAATVVALIGVTFLWLQADQRSDDLETRQAEIAEVQNADDVATQSIRLPNGARMKVDHSPSLDKAVVSMSALPEPPAGRSYQMWRIDAAGTARSAGVVEADDLTNGSVTSLLKDLEGVSQLAMTVEPAGGSEQPTSDPLVAMAIA